MVSVVDIHLRKLLWTYCPEHAGVKGEKRKKKRRPGQFLAKRIWSGSNPVCMQESSGAVLAGIQAGPATSFPLSDSIVSVLPQAA